MGQHFANFVHHNWAASYLVNDVYKRSVRPHASQKELVLISRIASGLLLALAFVWGGMIQPHQLERWILFINSSLIVFSLPLAWLKWFWWRMNVVGDMVGILGGFPAGYIVWFGSDAARPGVEPGTNTGGQNCNQRNGGERTTRRRRGEELPPS